MRRARELDWRIDGADWPNRAASRFVESGGLRWHVQVMGSGPTVLLAHGTGSATHSWRGLMPLLAARFTVVAPDLPGHGFTTAPPGEQMSLPGMAGALSGLAATMGLRPHLLIGNSAGAAMVIRACLDGALTGDAIIALNGALLPLRGFPGAVFAPAARVLASLPMVPRLFAWRGGDRAVVARLLGQTGSRIDAVGVDLYARLVASPGHVGAALAMMARWDLAPLAADLPRLRVPLHLVVGTNDRTIAPEEAMHVRRLLASARIERLEGLGHLAHEEQPAKVAGLINRIAEEIVGREGAAA